MTQAVESEPEWDEPWQDNAGAQSGANNGYGQAQDAEFSEPSSSEKPKMKVLPVVIAIAAFSSAAAFIGYQVFKPKNQGSASAAMSFPQPQMQMDDVQVRSGAGTAEPVAVAPVKTAEPAPEALSLNLPAPSPQAGSEDRPLSQPVPVPELQKEVAAPEITGRVVRLEEGMKIVINKMESMEQQISAIPKAAAKEPVKPKKVAAASSASAVKRLASKRSASKKSDSAGDESRFGLLGAIAEQAWIEDRATQKVTVVYVGDVLPGGEKVVRIDPVKSVVKTSRGTIQSE